MKNDFIIAIQCALAVVVQGEPPAVAEGKPIKPSVALSASSNAVGRTGSSKPTLGESLIIRNTFNRGPESWCSYDYHWSIVAKGHNIFIMTTWAGSGGVGDSGYVWSDETRWSADTPESPVSLLPFITYTRWVDRDALDLRDAQVSFYLRADDFQFHGSQCYFWVVGPGGRWHFTSQPLTVGKDQWPEKPNVLRLVNDVSLWHHSWPSDPPTPALLNQVLSRAVSYGISLVGFGQEPRGKFCMDEFEIRLAKE